MIDPKLAADDAATLIVNRCVFNGNMDPEAAKALAPSISAIVLTAIIRAIPAPGQGLSDK